MNKDNHTSILEMGTFPPTALSISYQKLGSIQNLGENKDNQSHNDSIRTVNIAFGFNIFETFD